MRGEHRLIPSMQKAWNEAVRICDSAAIRALLAAGVDANTRVANHMPPLTYAAEKGDVALCRLLIDAGAVVDVVGSKGDTALQWAVYYSHEDVSRLLLSCGANTSVMPSKPEPYYMTPFQRAVRVGSVEMVQLMVREHGEDLGQKTVNGCSLINLAGKNVAMKGLLRSLQTELSVQGAVPASERECASPTVISGGIGPL